MLDTSLALLPAPPVPLNENAGSGAGAAGGVEKLNMGPFLSVAVGGVLGAAPKENGPPAAAFEESSFSVLGGCPNKKLEPPVPAPASVPNSGFGASTDPNGFECSADPNGFDISPDPNNGFEAGGAGDVDTDVNAD